MVKGTQTIDHHRAGSTGGVGRVGGPFSMERLTELKTIVIDLG